MVNKVVTVCDVKRINAEFIPGAGDANHLTGSANQAQASDGRIFSAKTQLWHNHHVPVRLANELLYFVIAIQNKLPTPESAILEIAGQTYWGTEILPSRKSLTVRPAQLDAEQIALLTKTFEQSTEQRKNYLQAILLDIALLNSDRTPWNILGTVAGEIQNLCYYDHDRCFGWHGSLDHAFSESDHVGIDGYLESKQANKIAFALTSIEEFTCLFNALSLDLGQLAVARTQMPDGWLSNQEYDRIFNLVRKWWTTLPTTFSAWIDTNKGQFKSVDI